MTKITAVHGDITEQRVDAIVNAANSSLLGGSGVDGAIHRAGGPGLLEECKKLGGCKPGDAKITAGYLLPASYVIHTVGPVYGSEGGREADVLASCYRQSLLVGKKFRIKTIAFPAISTGTYGYPMDEAADVAIRTVLKFISEDPWYAEIRFVLFSKNAYQLYLALLASKYAM